MKENRNTFQERLDVADELLSDVAVKCCEVLNLAAIHGDIGLNFPLEAKQAARVVYLVELARKEIRQTSEKSGESV